jgi:hypothetical protein
VVNAMRRNTEALVSGGAAGSSDEGSVMELERGCGVVWPMTWVNSDRGSEWSMEKPKRARSRKTDTAKADLQRHERFRQRMNA